MSRPAPWRSLLRFVLPALILVAFAVKAGLNLIETSSGRKPPANARLDVYSDAGKLLAYCRALRVGDELLADPRPGSREQTLCTGKREIVIGETMIGTTVSKQPVGEAQLTLYNEDAKLIAECRARRVGGELVAHPRPGSREQTLCTGARCALEPIETFTYNNPPPPVSKEPSSAEHWYRVEDGRSTGTL